MKRLLIIICLLWMLPCVSQAQKRNRTLTDLLKDRTKNFHYNGKKLAIKGKDTIEYCHFTSYINREVKSIKNIFTGAIIRPEHYIRNYMQLHVTNQYGEVIYESPMVYDLKFNDTIILLKIDNRGELLTTEDQPMDDDALAGVVIHAVNPVTFDKLYEYKLRNGDDSRLQDPFHYLHYLYNKYTTTGLIKSSWDNRNTYEVRADPIISDRLVKLPEPSIKSKAIKEDHEVINKNGAVKFSIRNDTFNSLFYHYDRNDYYYYNFSGGISIINDISYKKIIIDTNGKSILNEQILDVGKNINGHVVGITNDSTIFTVKNGRVTFKNYKLPNISFIPLKNGKVLHKKNSSEEPINLAEFNNDAIIVESPGLRGLVNEQSDEWYILDNVYVNNYLVSRTILDNNGNMVYSCADTNAKITTIITANDDVALIYKDGEIYFYNFKENKIIYTLESSVVRILPIRLYYREPTYKGHSIYREFKFYDYSSLVFNNGYAPVPFIDTAENIRYFYIDKRGQKAFNGQIFAEASPFINGLARVNTNLAFKSERYGEVYEEFYLDGRVDNKIEKLNYLRTDGSLVFEQELDNLGWFSEWPVLVYKTVKKVKYYNYIHEDGTLLFTEWRTLRGFLPRRFTNGLAFILNEGYYGYIGMNGNMLNEGELSKFDMITLMQNHICLYDEENDKTIIKDTYNNHLGTFKGKYHFFEIFKMKGGKTVGIAGKGKDPIYSKIKLFKLDN